MCSITSKVIWSLDQLNVKYFDSLANTHLYKLGIWELTYSFNSNLYNNFPTKNFISRHIFLLNLFATSQDIEDYVVVWHPETHTNTDGGAGEVNELFFCFIHLVLFLEFPR